jgi:hypothetical protein
LAAVFEKNAEAKLLLCRIARCDPGEGYLSANSLVERTPHPALRATFSHKGRRKT